MPSWGELLNELNSMTDTLGNKCADIDALRNKYLKLLFNKTGRNIIAYYSGWQKPKRESNVDINDSDLTGIMNAIKGLDCSKGLDLILHTPGGYPEATEGIVKYLRIKFGDDIRVIVPHMAMSAGTMLACSAKTIVMGSHSYLGPIDPQFSGIAAFNILTEFQKAQQELVSNPEKKLYWELILNRYPQAFYYTVTDGINLSTILVRDWLKTNMFKDFSKKEATERISKIVRRLNANHKSHARHFNINDCREMGLEIQTLEDDQELQELVLSVHHTYVISIDATNMTKIIENHNGIRYLTFQGAIKQ